MQRLGTIGFLSVLAFWPGTIWAQDGPQYFAPSFYWQATIAEGVFLGIVAAMIPSAGWFHRWRWVLMFGVKWEPLNLARREGYAGA